MKTEHKYRVYKHTYKYTLKYKAKTHADSGLTTYQNDPEQDEYGRQELMIYMYVIMYTCKQFSFPRSDLDILGIFPLKLVKSIFSSSSLFALR